MADDLANAAIALPLQLVRLSPEVIPITQDRFQGLPGAGELTVITRDDIERVPRLSDPPERSRRVRIRGVVPHQLDQSVE